VNDEVAARFEADIDDALAEGELDRAEALATHYGSAAGHDPADGDPARSPRFRSAYLAAQVALAAGRLQQALDRLSPLLGVIGQLPREMAGRVRLIAAEALARQRRHAQAAEILHQVPAALLDKKPLLQLRALRIRLWLGEVAHRGEELVACASRLEAESDTANLSLLLCEEGRAWEAAGDLARAEACWQRADRLSRPLGADPIRADVLLQLARLDHLRGHLASALDRYETARSYISSGPQALELELRRLLVRLDLNQWDEARQAFNRLLPRPSLEELPEEIRLLAGMISALVSDTAPADLSDEAQAYRAAGRGDMEGARQLYRRALGAAPSPERQARLALALGLLAATQANPAEADSWLRRAEKLARERDLPEVLGRALQARGELAAVGEGDEDKARQLFEDAVKISEVQAVLFTHRLDAIAYRQQRGSVLRYLLRAACRRGDAASVFRYQELERGRLLLDLWQADAPRSGPAQCFERPELAALEREIIAGESELSLRGQGGEQGPERRAALLRVEEMRLRRDRLLEDYLRDRSRRGSAVLPVLPDLADLERVLSPRTLYLAPVLVDDELYLLAASRDRPARLVRGLGSANAFLEAVAEWRGCLNSQLARYEKGLPLGRHERVELDRQLEALAQGPFGDALAEVLGQHPLRVNRLVWVPAGPLHGLPLHALRRRGRYLVQDFDVVWAFSGAQVVHQARTRRQTRGRFRPAVVVTETPAVLPDAAREGQGVAASFWWRRTLHGAAATRTALTRQLRRARVVHFACHAHFDSAHPLAACVGLPSGEKLRAPEWLQEPVAGLPLVTLSACRSAEVAPLVGSEVFGLVTALLGGGVRAVLAGLWPVADRPARALMWRFYRARLTADLGTAVAEAQRQSLSEAGASPLFWAAFALFGDAAALPGPGRGWRWLARWRQRRHLRRCAALAPALDAVHSPAMAGNGDR
jgi:tetratricopeptide (TPR) repeat protein